MNATQPNWTHILSLTAQLETLAAGQQWESLAETLRRRDAALRAALAIPLAQGERVEERRRILEAVAASDQRVLTLCEAARSEVAERMRSLHSGQAHARDYARAAKLPNI